MGILLALWYFTLKILVLSIHVSRLLAPLLLLHLRGGRGVLAIAIAFEVIGESFGLICLLLQGGIILFALARDSWKLLLRVGDTHPTGEPWLSVLILTCCRAGSIRESDFFGV